MAAAPRRFLDVVLLLAVLLGASSYWIAAREYHPDEPASVAAIYRAGDIEYYPFIAALSRLQLSESVVRESAGEGVVRFLLWSSLPHGLGLRLFGPAGFFAVDLLGFVAFYFACVAMLRRLQVSALPAKIAALLMLCGAMPSLDDLFAAIPILQRHHISPDLWGLRIPRPFISSIPLCLCVALLFSLVSGDSRTGRAWLWASFGACLAILLQADPYQAGTIAICTPFILLYVFVRRTIGVGRFLKNAAIGLAAFILFALPYIIQQACELPDSARRLGVFPVDRGHPLWLPYPNFTYLRLAWIVAVCAALLRAVPGSVGDLASDDRAEDGPARGGGVGYSPGNRCRLRDRSPSGGAGIPAGLAGLCTASYLSLPLTCFVFGKTVQLYHFVIAFQACVVLTLLVVSLQVLQALASRCQRFAARTASGATVAKILKMAFIAAMLVFSARATIGRAARLAGKTGHMRSDFPEWRELGPDYRNDFTALVRELSKPDYANCEVAGTFDHQVYAWWATFRRGYCFLPDAALSTLPDAAMENRIVALCHAIGMDRSRFEEFIHRRYVGVFWLGHAKYQASSAHTFAPKSDYTPEQQRQIAKTGVVGTWNSLIPRSEAARLLREFDRRSDALLPGRLDLIILTKDESLLGLSPLGVDFAPAYSNGSFGVWRRRER